MATVSQWFFFLTLLLVIFGLYLYSQWLWLIIACQCLHYAADPPSEAQYASSLRQGAITLALLSLIGILAASGLAEYLSASFEFPNVRGALRYLPGMLILGMLYYAAMAIIVVRYPASTDVNTSED